MEAVLPWIRGRVASWKGRVPEGTVLIITGVYSGCILRRKKGGKKGEKREKGLKKGGKKQEKSKKGCGGITVKLISSIKYYY